MERLRLVLAFVFAPVSMGALAAMLSPQLGAWAINFAALVGYPMALIVGAPTYWLFRRMGWNGLLPYLALAALFSAILISLFIVGPVMTEGGSLIDLLSSPRLAQMGLAAFIATSSVLIFWLIARPDRSPQFEARKDQT